MSLGFVLMGFDAQVGGYFPIGEYLGLMVPTFEAQALMGLRALIGASVLAHLTGFLFTWMKKVNICTVQTEIRRKI